MTGSYCRRRFLIADENSAPPGTNRQKLQPLRMITIARSSWYAARDEPPVSATIPMRRSMSDQQYTKTSDDPGLFRRKALEHLTVEMRAAVERASIVLVPDDGFREYGGAARSL
jgi:hypothetical protein